MPDDELVCGIVVTFHPSPEHLINIARMREQVDLLVVVDNGSDESALLNLRTITQSQGFRMLENGENLGIATALNRGVREAQKEGCVWVALFDQDSALTDSFIAAMLEDFRTYRESRKIMQIGPRYLDPATGLEATVSSFEDGGLFLTMTSGSLFSMEAFERCGLFRDELFIYCVDDDYSLRIRVNGFFIGLSKNAVLLHQPGHPTYRNFLGRRIGTTNYRPESRYYYARNKVWLLRTYWKAFPRLIIPTLREFFTIPFKIALMEESPQYKIRMFFRGMMDGVSGKMGPLRLSHHISK